MTVVDRFTARRWPDPGATLTMLRPLTWFPPTWAYLCGVVSSGVDPVSRWPYVALGLVVAGPLVCGMSQAANDWCDRHVDAINEPDRPIPSGRVPGQWALAIALAMSLVALVAGWLLGPWGFAATCAGVVAAWAYSAEPVRLKRSGVWGPGLVGFCYEGLPWFTGAAVLSAGAPAWPVVALAVLYSLGAHGIMTLNDFKALKGDAATGVRSLPVTMGPERAARVACWVMILPQLGVVALLDLLGRPGAATVIAALVAAQLWATLRLLRDPAREAPWFNAIGTGFYILGMMTAAVAVRGLMTAG